MIVKSTRDVDVSSRFEHWVEMLESTYVALESQYDQTTDFYGSIQSKYFGVLELSIVQSTAPLVRRTPQLIAKTQGEYLLVHFAHSGVARVTQSGRIANLKPGDITVYVSTDPYELEFNGWFDTRVIKIPLNAVEPYLRNLADSTALVLPRDGLESAALRTLLTNVWTQKQASSHGEIAVSEAMIQILAAGLKTVKGVDNTCSTNLDAYYSEIAREYIRKNLRRETLNRDQIATAAGISSRHLARIFAGESKTVSGYVWAERLSGARKDLAQLSTQKGIAEIAYSWGFKSASHFSQAFKDAFGQLPGEWVRDQHLARVTLLQRKA